MWFHGNCSRASLPILKSYRVICFWVLIVNDNYKLCLMLMYVYWCWLILIDDNRSVHHWIVASTWIIFSIWWLIINFTIKTFCRKNYLVHTNMCHISQSVPQCWPLSYLYLIFPVVYWMIRTFSTWISNSLFNKSIENVLTKLIVAIHMQP